jgi:NADPH-dependent 2,4-dienoyl-CoA reductase/sulfur reductase-like enzyme/nitrite reductase/ring-hydroxylating ferredoxin subunit
MLVGHAEGEAVLLARVGDEVLAVGASCTHYGGPLGEGILVDDTVRCPWHHACFSLRTGEAVRAPALNPVACWRVERMQGRIRVTEKVEAPVIPATSDAPVPPDAPSSIVIVGTGAAGNAAAEMLRRRGHKGRVVMIGDEDDGPYDRPNLSKDYLAGNAPEEWIPLRPPEFYREHGIELVLGATASDVDPARREVRASDGRRFAYDRLLLATGAEPVRLPIPGHDRPHVHVLRSLADSRAIIEACKDAKQAVVVGASFIGLEVAASLRARDLAVAVVAPEQLPLARVFGDEMGRFIRGLHEEHGVTFHLEETLDSIGAGDVTLKSGRTIPADLVVVGVGVRPRVALATSAGAHVDGGVMVDALLETTVPGIFAAGDIARWLDPRSGERLRVEHWVVAERQGQTAARNMLGERVPYVDVPFFWSRHYDVAIDYVGHHGAGDASTIDGSLEAGDCTVTWRRGERITAVATIGRNRENLLAEVGLERQHAQSPSGVGAAR